MVKCASGVREQFLAGQSPQLLLATTPRRATETSACSTLLGQYLWIPVLTQALHPASWTNSLVFLDRFLPMNSAQEDVVKSWLRV